MHDRISILTLTPAGILYLAKRGYFVDMSVQDIYDKSKADVLAKSLVILQVSWVFLECVSPKAAGFPLAPLEIHTLVHAGCALLMYGCWSRKPLDVRTPIIVPSGRFQQSLALLLMQTPNIGPTAYDHLLIQKLYPTFWRHKRPPETSYIILKDEE